MKAIRFMTTAAPRCSRWRRWSFGPTSTTRWSFMYGRPNVPPYLPDVAQRVFRDARIDRRPIRPTDRFAY